MRPGVHLIIWKSFEIMMDTNYSCIMLHPMRDELIVWSRKIGSLLTSSSVLLKIRSNANRPPVAPSYWQNTLVKTSGGNWGQSLWSGSPKFSLGTVHPYSENAQQMQSSVSHQMSRGPPNVGGVRLIACGIPAVMRMVEGRYP